MFDLAWGVDVNKDTVYLNLVMEYIPETVHRVIMHYSRNKHTFPLFFIKLYMYQILRGLAYIHMLGISHRDIKPQNLLCDPDRCIVKVCDFGSAKYMVKDEPNVAYICSRYYRAPELILGATEYTTMVDVCVMLPPVAILAAPQRRCWMRQTPALLQVALHCDSPWKLR
ncbi:hypothetical protein HPB47_011529 [Ixodes persulcatus]|uniref:Uncharacterized protein n=1 Tax=Ixodes persulcatus TaxID=34615 RepID=A0AC60NW73_IXOPE|nr:hypothetical protein HPB47_011529 [Ixodes persulcatus]